MEEKKVLIIKAGYSEFLEEGKETRKVSLGDVLRTTVVLHLYKNDYVTWVTDEYAFPLLEKNPYIDRLLFFDWITFEQLKKERFDVLINLEKVPGVCVMADDIYARKRFGFTFNPETKEAEAYDRAFEVLAVSSKAEMKKINEKTAQQLLFEMVGEKWNNENYVLGYEPKTQEIYDVGLNTQIGQKWPTKAWSQENWAALKWMLEREGFKVSRQDEQGKEVLENLYGYIDWLNSCKLIVTNDSLGLHLGIALKKKILGLFGPTAHKEIEFYNRGKALLPNPNPDCMPCFKGECERGKKCMDEIRVEGVFEEIKKLLGNSQEKLDFSSDSS